MQCGPACRHASAITKGDPAGLQARPFWPRSPSRNRLSFNFRQGQSARQIWHGPFPSRLLKQERRNRGAIEYYCHTGPLPSVRFPPHGAAPTATDLPLTSGFGTRPLDAGHLGGIERWSGHRDCLRSQERPLLVVYFTAELAHGSYHHCGKPGERVTISWRRGQQDGATLSL